MAFQGYYIKNLNNGKTLSTSILKDGGDGYHATPDIISDKNAYTDGTGLTHRSPLPHTKSKVFIGTVEGVTESEKLAMQQVLDNYILMRLEYWNDNSHSYKTGNFYMPEIDWRHASVDKKTNKIIYAGISITLIEY